MDIQVNSSCVTFVLGEDCTIFYVEEHTALVREVLATEKWKRTVINAEKVENFDTAYLQLLLLINEYAKEHSIQCVMINEAPCIRSAMDAYGLNLLLSCGDSVCQKVF